jgi:alcohol dehydrogenase
MSVFHTTPRMITGPGSFDKVAEEASFLGAVNVMLVTGPNIVRAGYAERLEQSLKKKRISCNVFQNVEPDPSYQTAEAATAVAKEAGTDLVVGLGGGSNMDVAKVVSVLVTSHETVTSIFGVDKVEMVGLRKILVPTTAGTGSEVTPVSVLTDAEEGTKKAVVSPYLFPEVAVLDPELTLSMPPGVTAATGMDALVHAIEAYTSVRATSLTDLFATAAIERISRYLERAYYDGGDLEAREAMLEGSMLAGKAFGNAGVTATHAFSYPIGASYPIPHGVANSILLPVVMEFNMEVDPSRFAAIARFLGEDTAGMSEEEAARAMVAALRRLISRLDLPTRLSDFGVDEEDVPILAEGVLKVERILANNPRKVTLADAERLYRSVL